jgi:alkanesulfonate monooxygenase SsuD/methylene tetrahydromethanopterin reductase-like flavin-dependent oxidoreductase (luciferase family)
MAGRGSFIESFPLFGYDLRDYDALFADKLELLLHVRETGATAEGHGVYPRPVQEPLPIWVAVGGTPESAVRAGMLGLPMALAIIGGQAERFTPFAELHRRAAEQAGHERPNLSINSHGYIAETRQQALDESFPYVSAAMNRIGQERGWPPMQRPDYDAAATLRGANFVGTPEEVVHKILFQHELFGHDRFMIQFTIGGIPHEGILRSIELLGREVAPRVREELAGRGTGNRIAETA